VQNIEQQKMPDSATFP